ICWIFLLGLILGTQGCSNNHTPAGGSAKGMPWNASGKLKVLTSIAPVYCLTKLITGDDAEVLCLMTTQGPHDFEPTHDDVKILAEADLFIVIGLGLEEFLNGMVKSADNRKLKVVRTGLAIPTERRLESEGKPHYHGDKLVTHKGIDPHIWLGMEEAQYMVDAITTALVDRDARHAEQYRQRSSEVKKRLQALQEQGKEQLKNIQGGLVTFHDSFRYFSRSFGITVAGTIRDVKGDQPMSPAALREQAEEFKKANVRVIGVEPQYPRGVAENLAREIDPKRTKIIDLDPLETAPSLPGTSYHVDPNYYFEKIEQNLKNLQKAFE
ncbi:MAG TPA: metal ABC transporter substrate-binding protein, partial [Gemmatales bacterium]|nr:metal ABC transporter substrate-binding protein [Gemmatales bacterium]